MFEHGNVYREILEDIDSITKQLNRVRQKTLDALHRQSSSGLVVFGSPRKTWHDELDPEDDEHDAT